MKKIFKYPISGYGTTILEIPGQGKVLHCGVDLNSQLCVWIQVSARIGESPTKVVIHTFMTGEEFMASNLSYINTFTTGPLVIHAFQEK